MPAAIGVLGGTFDPVHLGHLHIARRVREAFDLPRVLLVPCASQPHKPRGPRASAADRLEMVRLAVEDQPGLEASGIEVERGGISYTIDTLDELRSRGTTPLFILGVDSVGDLPTWREHERLLAEFDLVAVDRPGSSIETTDAAEAPAFPRSIVAIDPDTGAGALLASPHRAGGRIFHLAAPTLDVSSSLVRSRIRAGRPFDDLVPARVARYIQDHGLYGKETNR